MNILAHFIAAFLSEFSGVNIPFKMVERKSIYSTSVYLYYILKILGMAFYKFEKSSNSFKVSTQNYLALTLTIAHWIFQSILHSKTEVYYTSGLNFLIVESIWRRVCEFQIFSAIPIILINFIKRKHVENFMRFIEKFDAQMEFLEWKNDIELSKIVELLPVVPIFVMILNYFMLIHFEWSEALYLYPPYVYHIKFIAYLNIMTIFFIICYLFVVSC